MTTIRCNLCEQEPQFTAEDPSIDGELDREDFLVKFEALAFPILMHLKTHGWDLPDYVQRKIKIRKFAKLRVDPVVYEKDYRAEARTLGSIAFSYRDAWRNNGEIPFYHGAISVFTGSYIETEDD